MTTPRTIGRYRIERELGRGSVGLALLARDSVLDRRVALKILRDDLRVPEDVRAGLVARMKHEACAAAGLNHPNVVTLHDVGEDSAVGVYLVFEYVVGETLRERLQRGPLPLPDLVALARELSSALAAAHDQGIVHRDVKPENVLFASHGAKIADFGIAHLPGSDLTQWNVVMGTPAYSAPEALAEAAHTPLSDQFSLAATLYEAGTGERAFRGASAVDVARQIARDSPAPAAIPDATPETSRAIDRVLRRAMAKCPADRFEDVRAFAVAFAAACAPEATREAPRDAASVAERQGPSSVLLRRRTNRVQNVLVAIALLVIVSLLVFGGRRADEGVSLAGVASALAARADGSAPPPPTSAPAKARTAARGRPAAEPSAAAPDAGVGDEGARDAVRGDPSPDALDGEAPAP